MPTYNVVLGPTAEKQYRKFKGADKERIKAALQKISESPFLDKPLGGKLKGHRRARVGGWRILYEIRDETVYVKFIDRRDKAYC